MYSFPSGAGIVVGQGREQVIGPVAPEDDGLSQGAECLDGAMNPHLCLLVEPQTCSRSKDYLDA